MVTSIMLTLGLIVSVVFLALMLIYAISLAVRAFKLDIARQVKRDIKNDKEGYYE